MPGLGVRGHFDPQRTFFTDGDGVHNLAFEDRIHDPDPDLHPALVAHDGDLLDPAPELPHVLELLADRGICCELCIQSNLLTGAISSAEQYGEFSAGSGGEEDCGILVGGSTDEQQVAGDFT